MCIRDSSSTNIFNYNFDTLEDGLTATTDPRYNPQQVRPFNLELAAKLGVIDGLFPVLGYWPLSMIPAIRRMKRARETLWDWCVDNIRENVAHPTKGNFLGEMCLVRASMAVEEEYTDRELAADALTMYYGYIGSSPAVMNWMCYFLPLIHI
eukprot:TRINITY_DN5780_c0_g1_i1.p1 TRINITY_DN5780_c0_g1~~TRINITY_DN5780_c0_g1_i1.p1  ORF type:complete len:152 (+),score=38.42 TRINITY_DN5780_c0_g1_i1:172-627(+)